MGLRKDYKAFDTALRSLYGRELLTLAEGGRPFDFDDDLFDEAAETVYRNGGFDVSCLTEPQAQALINETLRVIGTAVSSALPHEVPDTIRYALENNAFVFSGFKTFHSLREVGLSMLTEKGGIKPFGDFLTDARRINAKYNHNYLYAEYNHAIGAAQMAAKWHDFEQDGDRYNLQYRTAGDDKVREEHAILNGTTLPPSDPFWDMFLPPNGWNCRCTAVQVRKNKYPVSDPELAMRNGQDCTDGAKKAVFRYNPGKSLQLFPPKHPYFKAPEQAKQVIEQMREEQERQYIAQRRREIREYMAEHLDTPLVNPDFAKIAAMSNTSVKEFTNQPHKHIREKNELLMDIKRVFNGAQYLGINSKYQKKGVKASHIFAVSVAGEPSWLIVREYEDGRCLLHSCSDNPKIATDLIT